MTPDEYCQEKTQQSGSSFYYSFLFLEDTQRQAMTALYAFCREVDDIVDNFKEQSIASSKLNWWREEIYNVFHGKANHPVAQALTIAKNQYPLKESLFQEIISGMEMDLRKHQYADFDELKLYCYRVASVVGLLTIEILGYQHQKTTEYAYNLGIALQLINILRDVKEDLVRGRIYIPEAELKRFNINPQMLSNDHDMSAVEPLLAFQTQRAEQYFNDAFSALPSSDRYAQRTGIIMAEIYFALLQKIKKQHYPVLTKRVSISKLRKLWIAWTTARREYKRMQTL